MLRVGLDLRGITDGFKAHSGRGTGRYVRELIQHLVHAEQSCGGEISFIPAQDLRPGAIGSALLQCLPFGKYTVENQVLLPKKIRGLDVDLFHFFSHGDAPVYCQVPFVVTVLDLIPLKFPSLYQAARPNWRFRFARYLEYQAVQQALGVMAISECTKRDLVEVLSIDPERIVVTPLGVGKEFSKKSTDFDSWSLEQCAERAHFHIPTQTPVVVYVGGIDQRKNVLFLLEVFSEVLAEWREEIKPMLLLAGPYESDDQFPALNEKIRDLQLGDQVKLLGFLPQELLPRLYRAADLLVFPSLYEGFGLPVLEALACGTPVIAGNNSSLPEILENVAPLLPDNDRSAWVKETLRLLTNAHTRYLLQRDGERQVSKFSWASTADKTCAAYVQFTKKPDSDCPAQSVLSPEAMPKVLNS